MAAASYAESVSGAVNRMRSLTAIILLDKNFEIIKRALAIN